jgi:ATP synthase protein I
MADQRQSLNEVRRHYCRRALIVAVLLGAVLMLVGERLISKGLILGTLFSIANFSIMAAFIPLRLDSAQRRRTFVATGSYFLRYALLSAPLILAQVTGYISIIGVAVGLFMVQIVIMGEHLWARLRNPLETN